MLQRSLAQLAGHLRRYPEDAEAWLDLAHHVARTGTHPGLLRARHLPGLLALWRREPGVRAVGALVLPLLGLEPDPSADAATPWWRESGRLVPDPGGAYDRATGLPLATLDAVTEVPLRWVPRGRLAMGSLDALAEQPIHEVEVGGLYLGQGPVRVRELAAWVGAGSPGVRPIPGVPAEPRREVLEWEAQLGEPERPAVWVSWAQAAAVCAWSGGRLPTEAEWEWAARGPDGSLYPWGDARPSRGRVHMGRVDHSPRAWQRWLEDVGHRPTDVGPFGLVDQGGNALEWVQDWYGQYPDGLVADPVGPERGTLKVVRGGCYHSDWEEPPKASTRRGWAPSSAGGELGFRLARPLELLADPKDTPPEDDIREVEASGTHPEDAS